MNFEQTLEYLYSMLPMYQRVGAAAYKKDLGNILALCEALGNPHKKFKSIHVAGTNGKGSSTHILAAIAINEGYKTGYYTSPHLVDFRERIRFDGEMIPKDNVVEFVAKHKALIERIQPSFFEITVAMAFDHFAKKKVDLAIIETGLGGRLDSTNIINPLACLITNIGHDHMDMLGDTLPLVAAEKAGIIKQNTPVIISETQEEVKSVFLEKAAEMHADIFFADEMDRGVRETDLKGAFQQKNINGCLQTIEVLERHTDFRFPNYEEALKKVAKLTGFAGRWQQLSTEPLLIIDTGHNTEGIEQVVENLREYKYDKLHMVFGMVSGKDFRAALAKFPKEATYFLGKPNVPRGLDLDLLAEACDELGLDYQVCGTVPNAYQQAKKHAQKSDCIFVGGSTFTVADFLGNY